ncbi:MAG TPA: MFS transporter [Roseiflexaceae bacterium]|nr:MFS transporter [Roseiflexaceae bacterium]
MIENTLPAAPAPAAAGDGVWAPRRRPLTIGLVLTVAGAAFEALAVAATMPATTRELGGLALYGWAFSAFMLANLVGVTLAGPAADRRGPAGPFLLGVALFVAGLAGAGLAPLMPVLILARAVQGLGGGMISSVAYVAIGRGYPEAAKARMVAVTSTAWVVPGLIGPAVAGIITDYIGWRWVFLGLIPLPLVAAALALPALRAIGAPKTADQGPKTEDDAPGGRGSETSILGLPSPVLRAVQLAAGVGLVMAALGQGAAPLFAAALGIAGAALALPALRRMLPPGTLTAAPGMPAAVAAMALLNLAFFGVDAFVPLALSEIRGQSIAAAGLPLTAATLTWTAGSWVLAHLAARVSRRAIALVGMAVLAVGVAGVALTLLPAVPVLMGTLAWSVAGLGIGLAYSTLSLAVLQGAPDGQEGAASAAMQVAGQLGTALGTGIGGVIVGSGSTEVSGGRLALQCALMVAAAALGALVARRIGDRS